MNLRIRFRLRLPWEFYCDVPVPKGWLQLKGDTPAEVQRSIRTYYDRQSKGGQ